VSAFPEKVAQFGKIMSIYLKVGRFRGQTAVISAVCLHIN
jgi:hypothetical protein